MKTTLKSLVLACLFLVIAALSGCKKDPIPYVDLSIPAVITSISEITLNSAVVGGEVTSDGGAEVTDRGFCWNTFHHPTISDSKITAGEGSGTFTSSITGLSPNSKYYIRAYASNSEGTSYGNEISFITNPEISVATLSTSPVDWISVTYAISGGNIVNNGGSDVTARGVCWSTNQLPTTDDARSNDQSGSGSFSSYIVGLEPGTTYYLRAYAINNIGVAYGNQLSFTTPLQAAGTQKADFPGGARYSAASFSIGTKVYVGIGYNDGDWPVRDFWEWDQATNVWTRKADYPGNSTGLVVSFSIGTKGYIGTGNDFRSYGFTNEFWEYDPATNKWTKKAYLPTTPARALAIGFSIGAKGYIGIGLKDPLAGGGSSDYYNDFWEWDQATNVWTRKADFPGNNAVGAVGFSIGNKGYVGIGYRESTGLTKEFWEWDQTTDVWTKKADFAGNAREGAVGFSIGNKGYIGTGIYFDGTILHFYRDFWEWDQVTNLWTQKSDFARDGRSSAVGVSIGNKGYISTGNGGNVIYAFDDFWEYDPALQ